MALRTFAPSLECLEGREAPAILGGLLFAPVSMPMPLLLRETTILIALPTQSVHSISTRPEALTQTQTATPNFTVASSSPASSPAMTSVLGPTTGTSSAPASTPSVLGPTATGSSGSTTAVANSTQAVANPSTPAVSPTIRSESISTGAASTFAAAAVQTVIPVSQLTNLSGNLLLATLNPNTVAAGSVRIGDTLVASGPAAAAAAQLASTQQTGQALQFATPNGGGDQGDQDDRETRPQVLPAQRDNLLPDALPPLPGPDLGGAGSMLNLQPMRFENPAEQEDDPASSDDDAAVFQAGLPLWPALLLTSGSFLTVKRGRRREEDRWVDPDEMFR